MEQQIATESFHWYTLVGGLLGGAMLIQTAPTTKMWKKVSTVLSSGVVGWYIGHIGYKWLTHKASFLDPGDVMVEGAMGFVAGAVVPVIYGTLVAILNAIKSNPKDWVELLGRLKSNLKSLPNRRGATRRYEPPED